MFYKGGDFIIAFTCLTFVKKGKTYEATTLTYPHPNIGMYQMRARANRANKTNQDTTVQGRI